MTTWKSNLPEFKRQLDRDIPALRRDVAERALNAIVNGAPGIAPGQPEDLRQGQWVIEETGPDSTTIGTNDPSALAVEDGISRFNGHPIQLKSAIGGLHSVMLTHQNAEALVKPAVARVRGNR